MVAVHSPNIHRGGDVVLADDVGPGVEKRSVPSTVFAGRKGIDVASLSEAERGTRFRSLLESQFDMPGISKFVLARYWRVASDAERADFQRLFEDLLVQAYAKKFTDFAGERFQVASSQANDDDSITVNSLINRPNGDVVRLDWRVADAGGLKISDLIVDGVSLRTTYRSDVASVIQNNGGKVANLIDALRQKTGSQ